MSKIKWDLESARWVADKAQNDISAFPVELIECDKCGAVFLPHIGHNCKNTVEIEFHEGEVANEQRIEALSVLRIRGTH